LNTHSGRALDRLPAFVMLLNNYYIRLLFAVLLLWTGSLEGQTVQGSSAVDALKLLELRQGIECWYQPGWLQGKTVDTEWLDLPPREALDRIAESCNLGYVVIDSTSVIFLQKDPAPLRTSQEKPGRRVVGDPAESGRTSQAQMSGTVTDGATGEPLPGAILRVAGRKEYAITDREGRYSLTLPAGEHELAIQFVGYEELQQSVWLVSNGEADFRVFEKSLQLQTVVITDERLDLNISGTRMSTIRLDAKAIRELPTSLGESDLIRSVTLLPGVQSVGEFGSGFIVRGGNTDQNLILLEEMPLFNASHLFGLTSVVNSDMISSLTLFKAGIPARYGERASSVMSIRMGPVQVKSLKVKGGLGLLNSRLGVETPLGRNTSLLLSGRSSYSDWLLQRIPDVDLQNSSAGFHDLSGLLQSSLSPNDKLSLFGYYSADRFAFTEATRYRYSNGIGSVRWNHIFSKKLSFNLLAGISRYNFEVRESDSLLRYDASRLGLGIRYSTVKWAFNWFPGEKHAIEFGLAGILYENSPGTLEPLGEESRVQEKRLQEETGLETAVYLGDDMEVSPWLNMEAGLRLVRYSALGPGQQFIYAPGQPRTVESIVDTLRFGRNEQMALYHALEPRLALRFRLDEQRSVKLSYTRMNQFLGMMSNSSVISPTDSWKLSDAYLAPLRVDQLALGYFQNLAGNTVETSLEVYYKHSRHVKEYRNGAVVLLNEHPETDLLDARASGYGVELYLNKNAGRLTGWLSYTFSRTLHRTSGPGLSEQINENRWFPSNYDIPHNLVVNLNYHISRRWRFSSTFTWHTGKPVTLPELKYVVNGNQLILYSDRNKYRLPDYHRLDIALSFDQSLRLRKKWKGSWTLSVVNLYGRKNAFSAYYAKEDPRMWNYTGKYHLYTLYILGVPLPTITYNFNF